ncbi:MAG TPA: ABC transporter substrate-binding protein [Burkholderiales bacterium]|nr:ABC transporter substrate-binding protein [Burkholderiales bacterium]
MTRRAGLLFGLALAALGPGAHAAEPPRVGVLVFTDAAHEFREAFARGLRENGYVEGKSIVVDWRSAGGSRERAAAIANDYALARVDVIVASLTPAVQAAQRATRTIPIVMAPAGDPEKQGLVASLARPGGNITGLTGIDLSAKRVELLRELLPGLKGIGMLLNRDDPSFAKVLLDGASNAVRGAGIRVHAKSVSGSDEFAAAFVAMEKEGAGAVVVQPSLIGTAAQASLVASLAARHRLPSITQSETFADAGGLLSYGANFREQYRHAASFVARILKGEKPAVMPVEQASTFDLVVNLKTARALGVAIPPSILLRATRTID